MSDPAPEDLTLTVGGQALSGWTDVRATRRIEACPNDFDVGLTTKFPGQADAFVVQPGDPCTVSLGGDLVITGYIDRFSRGYDKANHTLQVTGRGKTQDLVDCSAEWPTGQIANCNALQIAQKLCEPYGLTASCLGDPGATIPQFNLMLGETAFDIIERVCRFSGLLAYEGTDGNLILANTQETKAASGFSEGVNVQSAHVIGAMDQRFSKYLCFLTSMDVTADAGEGGNMLGEADDPNVPRHRLQYLIAEAGGGGRDICLKRARWEAARRVGRGQQAQVIADAWRDSGGTLWTPNTKAPVSLPNLNLDAVTWTLGEVTYRKNAQGTTAEAMLMDGSAFAPEPILLQPAFPDVKAPDAPPAT